MIWSEVTYKEIEEIKKEEYIVILPLGSIEVHGPHLPLGSDGIEAWSLAMELAKRDEKVIVLPPLYYAYAPEAFYKAGSINLRAETLLNVLENICDEVGRNGFRKIFILNMHGGNYPILKTFLKELILKRKSYQVYALTDPLKPVHYRMGEIFETEMIGHACEMETSLLMYLRPELVKMERVMGEAETGRRYVVEGVESPMDWTKYAINGYIGNPTKASSDKGNKFFKIFVEELLKILKRIREAEY